MTTPYQYNPLTKYIVQVNQDGKAFDIEIYAKDATQAKKLVMMRRDLLDHEVFVRGEVKG